MAIVDFLVRNHHADVNATNTNGWHSLIFAVYGGHIDVVDYLLYETAVNSELRDLRQGRTALEIAEHLHDQEIIDLIKEW